MPNGQNINFILAVYTMWTQLHIYHMHAKAPTWIQNGTVSHLYLTISDVTSVILITEIELFGDFYWLPFWSAGATVSVVAGTLTNQ